MATYPEYNEFLELVKTLIETGQVRATPKLKEKALGIVARERKGNPPDKPFGPGGPSPQEPTEVAATIPMAAAAVVVNGS